MLAITTVSRLWRVARVSDRTSGAGGSVVSARSRTLSGSLATRQVGEKCTAIRMRKCDYVQLQFTSIASIGQQQFALSPVLSHSVRFHLILVCFAAGLLFFVVTVVGCSECFFSHGLLWMLCLLYLTCVAAVCLIGKTLW